MISSNSALAFCFFLIQKDARFHPVFFLPSFFFAGAGQKKKLYDHKKTGSLWLPVVLVFNSEIRLKLFKFPVVKGRLFFGHFFWKSWVVNVLDVLDKHFFDGLSAGFSCKCGHGSKVLDCGYLKFSDREALNRIDWIMSRVLVRLTLQSEYTESDRFLSPLTVPNCRTRHYAALRREYSYFARIPAIIVDVGSFVRISSIILWGGFCLLFL